MEDEFGCPVRQRRRSSSGIQGIMPFMKGDFLTADDFNELLEAIKELDRRIGALERAGS